MAAIKDKQGREQKSQNEFCDLYSSNYIVMQINQEAVMG
jgi:hypothetical protein